MRLSSLLVGAIGSSAFEVDGGDDGLSPCGDAGSKHALGPQTQSHCVKGKEPTEYNFQGGVDFEVRSRVLIKL